MPKIQQSATATALENNISEIHGDWQNLQAQSSSGQKAWLTQMKNHYTKIVKDSPEAAAELLSMYEHQFSLIKKHGFSANEVE
jgi:predicted lipoprotein